MAARPGALSAAALQQRILLVLETEESESVAALARRLEALRPSVSRSLRALEARELVARDGRRWVLTDSGRQQVRQVRNWAAHQAERALSKVNAALREQERWQRALGAHYVVLLQQHLDVAERLAPLLEEYQALHDRLMAIVEPLCHVRLGVQSEAEARLWGAGLLSIGQPPMPVEGPGDNLLGGVARPPGVAVDLSAAVAAAAAMERRYMDIVEVGEHLGRAFIDRLVAENLVGISRVLADLIVLRWVEPVTTVPGTLAQPVRLATTGLVQAQRAYTDEALTAILAAASADGTRLAPSVEALAEGLLLSTHTTGCAVGVARRMLDPVAPPPGEQRPTPHPWRDRAELFAGTFDALGPRYLNLWRAAWYELGSENPEWSRLAAHAGRELLTQMLEALTPDGHLASDECPRDQHLHRVTRATRVRQIVAGTSETSARWVEEAVHFVEACYALLSAEAHSRRGSARFDREGFAGILEVIAGLARFLISSSRGEREPK